MFKKKKILATIAIDIALLVTLSACNATVDKSTEIAKSDAEASIPQGEGVIHVSNAQLQKLLDQKVILIDIRRPEEWAQTGIVAGSKKLTFFTRTGGINPNLVPGLKAIASADQPVALICRTGNRTNVAAQMITSQLGYKKVYNVKNGITKWMAEGRKTVK